MTRPKGISCKNKGLNYDKIYGVEKAIKVKEKISKNHANLKGYIFKNLIGKRNSIKTEIKKGEHKSFKTEFKKGDPELSKRSKIIRAKQTFPLKDTKPEVIMQNFLKKLNIEFIPHHYINDIKHSYQCDIFIPSKNLIIECDGNYWHNYPHGRDIDHIRTKELQDAGYRVIRLWESEIKANKDMYI